MGNVETALEPHGPHTPRVALLALVESSVFIISSLSSTAIYVRSVIREIDSREQVRAFTRARPERISPDFAFSRRKMHQVHRTSWTDHRDIVVIVVARVHRHVPCNDTRRPSARLPGRVAMYGETARAR
jgi:hypothetical protein